MYCTFLCSLNVKAMIWPVSTETRTVDCRTHILYTRGGEISCPLMYFAHNSVILTFLIGAFFSISQNMTTVSKPEEMPEDKLYSVNA